jgi:cell division protein FtsN
MMGFGAMGMTSWVFGAIAVAAIWGGLWWLLSTIGYRPHSEVQPKELAAAPPLPEQPGAEWKQPSFEQPEAVMPTPLPSRAKPESDYR